MLKHSLAVACVAIAIVSSGCDTKPTHESIRKDAVETMKDIVEVLKDVKDESSAKSAKAELEKLGKELQAMKAEDDKLPAISADEEKRLDEKYDPEIKKVAEQLEAEMTRIGKDEKAAAVIMDAMPSML
jgi:hypothetical protein